MELANKITNAFNFIYTIDDTQYIIGARRFEVCNSHMASYYYEKFLEAMGEHNQKDAIFYYKKVREYTSEFGWNNPMVNNEKVREFLQNLKKNQKEDIESQLDNAMQYSNFSYNY